MFNKVSLHCSIHCISFAYELIILERNNDEVVGGKFFGLREATAFKLALRSYDMSYTFRLDSDILGGVLICGGGDNADDGREAVLPSSNTLNLGLLV